MRKVLILEVVASWYIKHAIAAAECAMWVRGYMRKHRSMSGGGEGFCEQRFWAGLSGQMSVCVCVLGRREEGAFWHRAAG